MSYQVIARKYRPQNFDEIVGQSTVTRTLKNALKSGRIAHAFLFSGVRGVGKTTAARILAKALNCHTGITPDPCDECVSCREIRETNCVDVQEIDAASNRGIDSIRELRESVRYGTARDRFKIFIIDEVHMLTKEAFNALLKTLEEPPPHVKFIMATTEVQKIPTTIASRCQKYEFKTIAFSSILERLREITEAEGITISDYALSAIATAARGSMRDAQSALDQVLAFSGDQVQDGDVKALLGLVDQGAVSSLVDSILGRDARNTIEQTVALTGSGISPQVLGERLAEHFRNLLVYKMAGWDESLLQLPDTSREPLSAQAERLSDLDLIRFYDLINRAEGELKWHSRPEIHLEMTLLKMIELSRLPGIEEVISNLSGTQSAPDSPEMAGGSGSHTVSRAGAAKAALKNTTGPLASPTTDQVKRTKPAPSGKPNKDPKESGQSKTRFVRVVEDEVKRFLEGAEKNFVGLFEQLKRASRISLSDGKLKICFPKSESFSASLIQTDSRRLAEAYTSITGSTPVIDIQVEENGAPESSQEVEPTEDPRIRTFLERFPSRITVRKERKTE